MRCCGAADEFLGALGAATGQEVAKYQRSDGALVGEAAILRVDPLESSRNLVGAGVVGAIVEAFEHCARHPLRSGG